jgi:hypothetical protein
VRAPGWHRPARLRTAGITARAGEPSFQIGKRVDDVLGFEGAIPFADSNLGQRACPGEPRYGFVGLRETTVYQLCGAVDGKHGYSRQRTEEQIRGRSEFGSVKGPCSASFDYTVEAESPTNTWSQQVSTIKGDDGQALSEPGIGDRAVWGGKEFAAEADGYIVGVIGADFPSTPQGSGFVRTGKIAKLLISKL